MTRNMGSLDRSLRAFVIAPAAIDISTYPRGVHRVGHHLRGGHA